VRRTTGYRKVLAVASSGGHRVQLRRLVPAFRGCELVFVTTVKSYRSQVGGNRYYSVTDARRRSKLRLIRLAAQVLGIAWILAKEAPGIVISTGTTPGYFAVVLGHFLGAKTIWVDSMANMERLSLAGSRVGWCADLWLTQWPGLARTTGPMYVGSVI